MLFRSLPKENVKIQKDLDACRKALEDSQAQAAAQKDKDAAAIRDLEAALRACQEEVDEMDKHLFGKFRMHSPFFVFIFLASSSGFLTCNFSGISAEESAPSRIERIRTLGEFIEALKVSGRKLVEKIIPERQSHYSDLIQLPNALDIAVAQYDVWMHSAARGGVRMALGLMQMHYTTAESWRLATSIPSEYTEIEEQDL